jgi:DNA-binding CsgD family transcriptional regulator
MTRRTDMTARGRKILAQIRQAGPLMEGSLTFTRKRCGNPECRCAEEGPIHPTALLTWKEGRVTHTRYVPVEDREEVARWVAEGKRIKRLLKALSAEQRKVLQKRRGRRQ